MSNGVGVVREALYTIEATCGHTPIFPTVPKKGDVFYCVRCEGSSTVTSFVRKKSPKVLKSTDACADTLDVAENGEIAC